jgi:protein-S-isoprenylcysteine O-methyltransferase Ste14
MVESIAIWLSRLASLGEGLPTHVAELCGKRALVYWSWADRALVLLTLSTALVRIYGSSPHLNVVGLAFPLFLVIIVFRSPLLTGPLPSLSGFMGMVISYPALAFLEFPGQPLDQILPGHSGVVFLCTVLFYILFLGWAFYSMGRSFAIFPSARRVVTRGPYSIVRHPMYSSYLHLALCITMLAPTLRNVAVTTVFASGLLLRAKCEEGLLAEGQAYGGFRNRVKNRFFSWAYSTPAALAAAVIWLSGHWRLSLPI